MSEITLLEVWRDTGFTEGAVEVPKVGQTLSNPNFTFDDGLYPSKNRLFSQFKVEGAWYDLFDCSYLRMTLEVNNPRTIGEQSTNTITLYGWIDSIALNSDNDDKPMTVIDWHIDYWRTYSNSAHYGYGMVTRRPKGDNDPIQSMSYRYRLPGEFTSLEYSGYGHESYWVILSYTKEENDGRITKIRNMIMPISKTTPTSNVYAELEVGPGEEAEAVKCPSMQDFIEGTYDEKLGISGTSCTACYISPVPPVFVKSGTGTSADPYILQTTGTGTSTRWTVTSYNNVAKYVTSMIMQGSSSGSSIPRGYSIINSDGSYQMVENQPALNTYFSSFNGKFDCSDPWYTGNNAYKGGTKFYINGVEKSSSSDGIFSMTLNDYIKASITETTFNALSAGDKVKLPTSTIVCSAFERSATVTRDASLPKNRVDFTVTKTETETREFTVSVSGTTRTFGDYWVYFEGNPRSMSFQLETAFEFTMYSVNTVQETVGSTTAECGYIYNSTNNYADISASLDDALVTTDTKEWIFTDLNGNPMGSIPWGISVKDYTMRTVVTTTGGYIEYRFGGIDSHSQGTCFTVSLPTIDITSNSWSDYVYSGQRDYDIRQRDIANKQALVDGIVGSVSGAGMNAVLGYMGGEKGYKNYKAYLREMKSEELALAEEHPYGIPGDALDDWTYDYKREHPYKKDRRLRLASIAGFGGSALGIAGSFFAYGLNNIFNAELQHSQDQLSAKQLDNITTYGTGWDWLWKGRECGFISLVADNYSLDKFSTDITLNGIICSEPMSDCDTMIKSAEGPLQVTGLIITGDIPVQAKYAIRDKLASGVRLI